MCDEVTGCRSREERHRLEQERDTWRQRALTAEAWMAGDGIAEGLREALRPFAEFVFGPHWMGHEMRERDGDVTVLCGYDADGKPTGVDVDYSDFARARAALTPAEKEGLT